MQGLRWYKMPIQDPLSPGLYPAENLVPIYKVQRAKGHWKSQKPRIGAVFHWVNAYSWQSTQKLKVLFTLLRPHSSSVVCTSLPWQIQTKPAPNHAAPAVRAEDPTADQPSQPVPNIHSTSGFPPCLGHGFLLNLHLPGQVPCICLAHQPQTYHLCKNWQKSLSQFRGWYYFSNHWQIWGTVITELCPHKDTQFHMVD